MPGRLHHVQWCVRSIEKTTLQLTQSYGFNFTHHRDLVKDQRVLARQNVLRSGDTVFVLTQNDCADPCDLVEAQRACLAEGQFPFLTCCKSRDSHKRDTVFNVCLSVGDVNEVLDTISKNDCDEQTESVILEATEIQGNRGTKLL